MNKTIITRTNYLKRVEPYIDTPIIKVFTGQRRVGKSYIMKMIVQYIRNRPTPSKIIYIDKEQYDFDFISDYHQLIHYIERQVDKKKKNYVFIDEIQEIEHFEKALRHFLNKEAADIYCTGSNAEILSGDLATLLSGRYVEIKVHALSYSEFLLFNQYKPTNDSLQNYLKWGGLPFIKNLQQNDEVIFDYLNNIVATIIYKDILYRYKVRNVNFFDTLIRFIAANTGNLITAMKISDYLKSQKTAISTRIVINYLHFLQNAFLVYKVNRFDIQTKKVFAINHKYFFEDWGLRNALLGLSHFSVPDVLENVVFTHLQRLGYQVSVGLLKQLEIDFIAEKSGKTLYIQVAYLLSNEKVKAREFGNLLLIQDNYPKMVVTLDDHTIADYKGIRHMHLQKFLLSEVFDV